MIAVQPRLGMVGGGQLARMTFQAAIPFGMTLQVLAEQPLDSAAFGGAAAGAPDDYAALERFAQSCDVVTFDHELVPPELLERLEMEGHALRPSAPALLFAQDKLHQRQRLSAAGFPVPAFRAIKGPGDVAGAGAELGWPLVLKLTRGGYDGRGVWIAATERAALDFVATAGRPLIAEAFVPLDRELATLVARGPDGSTVGYPIVDTVQVDGMCREIHAAAAVPAATLVAAQDLARSVVRFVGAVGVVAVELFLTRDGALLVNELALRPHNSGHYTIEGCETSQFENHIRAVMGWPLGSAALKAPAVSTVNIVGPADGSDPRAALPQVLRLPGVHPHLYGKEARPGRKLGHVTALGQDVDETRRLALHAAAILTGEPR